MSNKFPTSQTPAKWSVVIVVAIIGCHLLALVSCQHSQFNQDQSENDEHQSSLHNDHRVRLLSKRFASASASASTSSSSSSSSLAGANTKPTSDADDKAPAANSRPPKAKPSPPVGWPIVGNNDEEDQEDDAPPPRATRRPRKQHAPPRPTQRRRFNHQDDDLEGDRRRPRYEEESYEDEEDYGNGAGGDIFHAMAIRPMNQFRNMMGDMFDQMQSMGSGAFANRPGGGRGGLVSASSSFAENNNDDEDDGYSRTSSIVSNNGRTRGLVSETRNGRTQTRRIGEWDNE